MQCMLKICSTDKNSIYYFFIIHFFIVAATYNIMLHFVFPECNAFISSFAPDVGYSYQIEIQFFVMIHKRWHVRTAVPVGKADHAYSYAVVGADNIFITFSAECISA